MSAVLVVTPDGYQTNLFLPEAGGWANKFISLKFNQNETVIFLAPLSGLIQGTIYLSDFRERFGKSTAKSILQFSQVQIVLE